MGDRSPDIVTAGRIAGAYGVRGWVKVVADTESMELLLNCSPWLVGLGNEWRELAVADAKRHGSTLIARFAACHDRDQVRALTGQDIALYRRQLPEPEQGEYYWADLVGLQVQTREGVDLGVIDHLIETGANDVLVVRGERERLIPYIKGQVVLSVDIGKGVMQVDWDPEF